MSQNSNNSKSNESPQFVVSNEESPPFVVSNLNEPTKTSEGSNSNGSNISRNLNALTGSKSSASRNSTGSNSATGSNESEGNSSQNSNESNASRRSEGNSSQNSNESNASSTSNASSGSNSSREKSSQNSNASRSLSASNASRGSNESERTSSQNSNESSASNESSDSNAFEGVGVNVNQSISPNSGKKIKFNRSQNNKTKRLLPKGRVFFNKTPPNNTTKPILEKLFNAIQYKAYILQKYDAYMKRRKREHTAFDMYYLWNPLDVILTTSEFAIFKAKSWSNGIDEKTKKEILELNEVNEYGVINHRNHALIQQIKIPLREPRATIPYILKVAFYAGIHQGFMEGDGKKYYPEYPINTIYDVIEKEDVDRLSVKPRLNQLLEKVTTFLDNYPDPPKILSKNTRSKRVNLAANI